LRQDQLSGRVKPYNQAPAAAMDLHSSGQSQATGQPLTTQGQPICIKDLPRRQRAEKWEELRKVITDKYTNGDLALKDLVVFMTDNYQFCAT